MLSPPFRLVFIEYFCEMVLFHTSYLFKPSYLIFCHYCIMSNIYSSDYVVPCICDEAVGIQPLPSWNTSLLFPFFVKQLKSTDLLKIFYHASLSS
jgi:hypothetical protein